MGWLYSERWSTRKDLISHLLDDKERCCKVLKYCCVGNHLWTLNELTVDGRKQRFITLFMMQFHGASYPYWGYKDVEETSGPAAYSCPISYIDQCTEPHNDYSRDWRIKVRERHALKNRRLNIKDKFSINNRQYVVCEKLPRSGYVVRQLSTGNIYRMPLKQMLRVADIIRHEV